MMRRLAAIASVVLVFSLGLGVHAGAEETASAQPYSGDFFRRSTLTGDWGGARNDLAAKGVAFDASVTQVAQGVVSGGKDSTWQYGGRADLVASLNTQKLGLWPGGFLTLELEGNWADSVNESTGALMTANTNQIFPFPAGSNFGVPALNFAQFLSPTFGFMFGKLATLSSNAGDMNEFAHGKGDTQFMNLAFNINPTALVTIPYSPLGAGVIILPTKDPSHAVANLMIMQSEGVATTSGFENLNGDELTFAAEGRLRTGFFGLTGHQLLGASYSNKEFTSLDQRIVLPPSDRTLEKADGSWHVHYNFDQYFYEPEKGSGRGIGIFGRFGAADGNPNFMQYFYSAGIGGKGFFASRPDDRFGIGYYYIDVENPRLQGPLETRVLLRSEWGFEAFYNVAITPWMLLTPDIQVIGPSQKHRIVFEPLRRESVDTAVVLGFRLQLVF